MNKSIEHCKWRSPKAAWIPVLLTIIFSVGSVTTLLEGLKTTEVSLPFICLSAVFGIMAMCVAYLIVKKGQSKIASGTLLLFSLGTFFLIIPGANFWTQIGAIVLCFLIGLPISLYWNKVCKKPG